jgi:TRAP-type C4-dicarboxylate transport system substrate-binding protein
VKKILFIFICLYAILLQGCSEENQNTVLKVHHFLPPKSNAHAKFIVPWCQKIEETSAGEITCEIYPAMQLGGTPPQLFDQARDGVVDIVWTIPGYSAGRFPGIEVFELPFMMKTAEATSQAMWDYVAENGQDEFADIHLLATHVHGPGVFHMTEKPIKTLSDLKGLKIRAPTRLTNKLISALGAIPVGMPIPSVPEALAKGVIDGTIVPYEVVPAIKANELTKFHSDSDPDERAIYTTAFIYAMNKAAYENLPQKHRKIIDDNSGRELSRWIGHVFSEGDKTGKSTVSPESINTISKTELQHWKTAADSVRDEWIEEMNQLEKNGALLFKRATELTEKYDNE